MRIAIFVGQFPTISETFILRQITGLLDRRHQVDIYPLVKGSANQAHPAVDEYGLWDRTIIPHRRQRAISRVFRFPLMASYMWSRGHRLLFNALNPARYGWDAVRLRTLEEAYRLYPKHRHYDVIHAHFGPQGVRALSMRDIGVLDGPILTSFHGLDVSVVPRKNPTIYEKLFREGNAFTANSDFTRTRLLALGCPEDGLHVLPEGLNPCEYHFQPRSLRTGETVKIFSIARHVEKKGLHYAIAAFAVAQSRYPAIEYYIAGDGPMRAQLEALITEQGLQGKVFLLGAKSHDEIIALLDDMHLFMQPSITANTGDMEGQGLVIQEAEASGLPVLTTWHNGIPTGVIPDQSAFLVPERDVKALADRLQYLVSHPEHWPKMGRAGRKLVEEKFDVRKLNDRLVEIYKGLQ